MRQPRMKHWCQTRIVLEESAGPLVAAEDAQAGAQETQAHARRRSPQPRRKSSAEAVVLKHRVLPSDRSHQERLETSEPLTWMSKERAQT